MKFRVILGSIFVLFQFIPLGGYHFEGEAHIVGGLYNILFPHGVLSVVLGGFLIFYERWGFKRLIPLNYLLILGGTMIVLVMYEMYGGESIQYYRVEKLEEFSPTVYAFYLSLSGKPVYPMGYPAIIIVLLIYVTIKFRAGSSGRGVR